MTTALPPDPRPTVAIAGGGVAGAALALHLLRGAPRPLRIVVIEPRDRLGHGLAYGTTEPGHRINVPSDRMTVLGEAPRDFTAWMEATGRRAADPFGEDGTGAHYARRTEFGAYMAERLAEAATAAPRHALIHLKGRAAGLTADGLVLEDGSRIAAWRVVLATSHDRPALPAALAPVLSDHPGFVADPWAADALDRVAPQARVAILGTGLTMVDVVAALRQRGHRGPITAISRRGQLPRPHAGFEPLAEVLSRHAPPPTALAGLRLARRLVAEEIAAGRTWHHAIDGMRRDAEAIWQGWPVAEQARALARLRAWWDVHRFRIAPQLHALIAGQQAAGRLRVQRGGIAAASTAADGTSRLAVGTGAEVVADAVVNCLGPCPDIMRRADPLLQGAFRDGRARPDAHRLGLDVDAAWRLRDANGQPQDALRAVGPLTRGVFWELVGVPELAAHCARLAARLSQELADTPAPIAPEHTAEHTAEPAATPA